MEAIGIVPAVLSFVRSGIDNRRLLEANLEILSRFEGAVEDVINQRNELYPQPGIQELVADMINEIRTIRSLLRLENGQDIGPLNVLRFSTVKETVTLRIATLTEFNRQLREALPYRESVGTEPGPATQQAPGNESELPVNRWTEEARRQYVLEVRRRLNYPENPCRDSQQFLFSGSSQMNLPPSPPPSPLLHPSKNL